MTPAKDLPMVTEKSQEEIERITELVDASNLPEDIKPFVIGCINLACWIPGALVEHKITVSNLKRLIFGKGDKKTKTPSPPAEVKPLQNAPSEKSSSSDLNEHVDETPTPKGHGRLPHTVYTFANEHYVELENLTPGSLCPLECGGTLYRMPPGILVNIKGQNLASVDKYWLEKLRCGLCNEIFTADAPSHVCKEKYHPSFKAMLALQKYHMAMPFHRQEHFQSLIGFPIPASTQWYLMEELASSALLVFPTLERLAANGELIHNDDTVLRIVDLIHHNRLNPEQKRTGIFTTGILAQNGAYKIALFYNSKRHKNQGNVIQMCDALNHNIPENHETIVCNCLSHAFRKFEEIENFYPEICQTVMKWLAVPFKVDEASKQLGHNNQQRLLYHQEHSQSAMSDAKEYMEELLKSKQVEPSEALGKAKSRLHHKPVI